MQFLRGLFSFLGGASIADEQLQESILYFLWNKAAYGSEIVDYLNSEYGASIRFGDIYPLLTQMERESLVSTFWGEGNPPPLYYQLTPYGVSTVQQMD